MKNKYFTYMKERVFSVRKFFVLLLEIPVSRQKNSWFVLENSWF